MELLNIACKEIAALGSVEQAQPMERYLKNKFPMFGVKTPERKTVLKKYLPKKVLKENVAAYLKEVKFLWDKEERDYQYVAMYILEQLMKEVSVAELPLLKYCIQHKSWWDTVDLLAAKNLGAMFKGRDLFKTEIASWIADEDMWLNRSAMLVQLKYKEATDLAFLEASIVPHLESKEFFLQKAIGWVLREYAKTDAQWVIDFCEKHTLKPLSRREALRLLQ